MDLVDSQVPTSSPPKFKAGAILAILALVIALPVLVKSVRTRQLTRGRASVSAYTSKVMINPGIIITDPGAKPIYLSALAYDQSGNPLFSGVTYDWGVSSDGSLGILKTNNELAEFRPLNSTGSGFMWVNAKSSLGAFSGYIQICQGVPCPTTPPPPPPTPVPFPPISWETNYARLKATNAYLQVKDQMFYGIPDKGTSITIYSQPPTTQNPNFTTLETSWIEHGIKMRILIQFNKTTASWWASDLALYMDDRKISGQGGVFFKTNLGRPYFQKNLDVQDNGLHLFAELFELQAFTSPTPTPRPTSTPTPTPIPVSLLKNSSFETDLDNNKIPDQWLAKNLKTTDGLRNAFAHQGKLSFMFSPLTAANAPKKQLYQSLPRLGSANEALTLSLWSMTNNSVSVGKIAAIITINYTDGTSDSTSAVLPRFVHKWTQRVVRLVTSKPYNSIKVNLTSSNQSSEFLLDDLSLTSVKSAFAKGLKTTPSDLTTTELAEFK